jgi:hypothetical protein
VEKPAGGLFAYDVVRMTMRLALLLESLGLVGGATYRLGAAAIDPTAALRAE